MNVALFCMLVLKYLSLFRALLAPNPATPLVRDTECYSMKYVWGMLKIDRWDGDDRRCEDGNKSIRSWTVL